MPLAPLADPWSKKVELKEDLEVLLLYLPFLCGIFHNSEDPLALHMLMSVVIFCLT